MKIKLHNLLIAMLVGLGVLTACSTAAQTDAPANNGDAKEAEDAPPKQPEPPAADPAVVALLDKIEAASAKLNTLKARIRYTRTQTLTGDQQQRFGDFHYTAGDDENPTRFSILFDRMIVDGRARPMETWFIFDGNWLLERDHEDKTATRRQMVPEGAERSDILNMGNGQLPIPLKLKTEQVLKTYTVKRLKDEKISDEQTLLHLKMTPLNKKKDAPVDLWFDQETLLLYKIVTEEDADEIEVLLPRPEPNVRFKPGVFDTRLPAAGKGWQLQEVPIKK